MASLEAAYREGLSSRIWWNVIDDKTDKWCINMQISERSKKNSINVLMTLIVVIGLMNKLITTWGLLKFRLFAYWDYDLTSWMITYYGTGYVRRGLLGSIIAVLAKVFDAEPQYIIITLAVVSFLSVSVIFIVLFARKGISWWIFPASFGFFGLAPLKPDMLIMLLVLAQIAAYSQIKPGVWRFFSVNAIGVIAMHIHEIAFLMTVPMLMLLSYSDLKERGSLLPVRRVSHVICFFLPQILCLALLASSPGTSASARSMVDFWRNDFGLSAWWNGVEFNGIYMSIGCDAKDLMTMVISNLTANSLLFCVVSILIFLLVCRMPFLFVRSSAADRSVLPAILVVQIACLFLLLPVFSDYSRLFAFCVCSTYMFYLMIPADRIICFMPDTLRERVAKYDAFSLKFDLLLFSALPFVGMSIWPFSCKACFRESMVGNVCQFAEWVLRHF